VTIGLSARVTATAVTAAGPSIDAADFRHVLGHFASGVTVVTSMSEGEPVGFACQSFFSVSLEPPLIGFCAGGSSTTWPKIRRSGHFCVNILGEQQSDLCRTFAVSGADKFRDVRWARSRHGNPRLHDVLAWIDCEVHGEYDAGDHVIVIGRVQALEVAQEDGPRPLLFFRGGYGRFDD
jgi:flavin reductase (DIM6/NTAB) family NADH-FMN oxidoreductase RutF